MVILCSEVGSVQRGRAGEARGGGRHPGWRVLVAHVVAGLACVGALLAVLGAAPARAGEPLADGLSGVVLADGQPFAGAIVSVHTGDRVEPVAVGVTDHAGRFAFGGLAPGRYAVRAARGDAVGVAVLGVEVGAVAPAVALQLSDPVAPAASAARLGGPSVRYLVRVPTGHLYTVDRAASEPARRLPVVDASPDLESGMSAVEHPHATPLTDAQRRVRRGSRALLLEVCRADPSARACALFSPPHGQPTTP